MLNVKIYQDSHLQKNVSIASGEGIDSENGLRFILDVSPESLAKVDDDLLILMKDGNKYWLKDFFNSVKAHAQEASIEINNTVYYPPDFLDTLEIPIISNTAPDLDRSPIPLSHERIASIYNTPESKHAEIDQLKIALF